MPLITFLGGARTVTGSKYLLDLDGSQVMVDCGLFQGDRALRDRNWRPIATRADELASAIITHAHLDHCGYLPRLHADGFEGAIYGTTGTIALASIILADSAHLQEEEARFANQHGYSKHRPALPLYDAADVEGTLPLFRPMDLGDTRVVAPGITASLARAGHILGSAIARIDLAGTSVVFSGDLGRPSHPILREPEQVGDADWIVVESTYGDRAHHDSSSIEGLRDVIRRTIARRGTVVIPAFAVDRTEVLLHHLGHLADRGELPQVPVYVDSPMALASLRVYRDAIRTRSPEVRQEILDDPTPFLDDRVVEVRDVEASKRLTASDEPKIIVSASGMATGGRVVHHLARFLEEPTCSVVLVGYQAQGTRGQALLGGATQLKMLGRYVRVRAEIVNMPAFSVHADSDELMAWLRTASRPPRGVFLVHGELGPARTLARRIEEELDWHAVVPQLDETLRL
jgi:metallo-beta-lactamase family protein